jgi:hypothetical protein
MANPIPCVLPQMTANFPSSDKFIQVKPTVKSCNFSPVKPEIPEP